MKYILTKLFFCSLLLICSLHLFGADKKAISGHWEGAISREGSVQLLKFNFGVIADSVYGSYDDISIEVYQAALTIKFNKDTILLSRFGYGEFKCLLSVDQSEIIGANYLWDPVAKIHLKKRGQKEAEFFTSEDISYKSGASAIYGSLLKPVGKKTYPIVILLHGAGYAGRDAPYYSSIAYKLAQNGIAVFYFDQRGYGKSEGDLNIISLMDTRDDAIAAINYLKQRKDISYSKLGIIGYSRGGWLAEMIATKKDMIDFIILHAGPARSIFEQDIDRVQYGLKQDGFDQRSVDSAVVYQKAYFNYAANKLNWEQFEPATDRTKGATWLNYVTVPGRPDDDDIKWWRRYKYDPSEDLCKITVPVLAVFGEDDILVHPEVNKPLMEKYLRQSGIPFEIAIMPKAFHSMQVPDHLEGKSWEFPKGHWVWRKKADNYYPTIINWINRLS